MFFRIAGFELRYQMRSPVFWVAFGIFFLLTFGATTIQQIQIGSAGNTFINAPFSIITKVSVMTLFATFALTAFVANVVVRDDDTGYGPIIRATPITKFDYLFGRFTGAFAATALMAISLPLGILIGSCMPWLDPVKLGPFRPGDYLFAYFVMILPTMFVLGAVFFALATATRSMMATYVGVVAFLGGYLTLTALFSKPDYDHIVGLLEPLGMGAFSEVTKYWTTQDRNTRLPDISGIMLENRLIWFAAAFAFLAIAYFVYRTQARAGKATKASKADLAPPPVRSGPLPAPVFDAAGTLRQSWKWTRFEMAQVFRSPAFFVLLALGLLNSFAGLAFATDQTDFTILPVTNVMIRTLMGTFSIIPMIVAIYYAGELVWRERDRRTHEVFDACPVPDWAFVVPKIAAISLVLFAMIAISTLAGVTIQIIHGYTNFEWSHYLLWYVVPETIVAIQFAALAVFVQAVSPHKYVGWGVMVLIQIGLIILGNIGFENLLYLYGRSTGVPLSDMNNQGTFWIGRAWFQIYWSAFALILSIFAYALWRRGTETRLKPRFQRLPRRLAGFAGVLLAFAVVVWVGVGAFIHYNTAILNPFRTSIEDEAYAADYEKALLAYRKVAQPRITDVTLNVAIYPHQKRVETRGVYTIENKTGAPLGFVHVRWDRDLHMDYIGVQGAHIVKRYDRFFYFIYAFDKPMQPGEKRTMTFNSRLEQDGFKNRDNLTQVVDNGTFINDTNISPQLGMDTNSLLSDPVKRRRYHLPSELRPAKLEDDSARANSYISNDSDWVNSDITVSTVADQTPIAPGYVVSDVTKDGRRTVHFKSDAPILKFFSMQSAAYAQKHDKWHNVDLTVYYDRKHPFEVDRMIRAMKAAMDVYNTAFSPYQFHQARFIEFPGYAAFAQSFANTVPWSEDLGFIQDDRAIRDDNDKIDMVTFVAAHELGHQWWAHQIIGANMQGMTMLSETFARYSAMLVMERLYGPDHIRKFLKHELDSYLRSRGSEEVEELPLVRVENQPYIHYRKGAVIMYRLKQEVGEDVVNRALRRLLKQYAFKGAPYPSSKDFVRFLREEAGPKYDALITDLFEKITIYDLKAQSATWTKRPDGKYDVALTISAHKFYADGKGIETETRLDEPVPVGVFSARPQDADFGKTKVLSLASTRIMSGIQIVHVITAAPPKFAGVDPYNLWIDRNSDDNLVAVTGGSGS